MTLTPNAFPAARFAAKRDAGDDAPIEYIQVRSATNNGPHPQTNPTFLTQDPDTPSNAAVPTFMLRLSNEDELIFNFTFFIRQTQTGNAASSTINGVASSMPEVADTNLTGLTLAHASNSKELDNLITREFHANPNLQNNSNVQLIGDYSTGGTPSVTFDWTWTWKSPKPIEDKGGGWRNSCSFLDYDQRTNRLNTLAHFSFWVQNSPRLPSSSPQLSSPKLELPMLPRSRIPSTQSVLSHNSDVESNYNTEATSPDPGDKALPPQPTAAPPPPPAKVDLPHSRAADEMSGIDDGPLFRATMKALESKTNNMRTKIKKVLKKAEGAQQAQANCNEAVEAFLGSLNDASTSNANAIQPALDHYFENIARQILKYEQLNTLQLQKLVIEPLVRLYHNDIKQAEVKKKEWEEESRDYYAYVSRYLGQRQDSLKEKKRAESDSKYQVKRRNFELRRFDYSSFMQDLHGGRKEQEVLSHLTKYADFQAKNFLATAKNIEGLTPQLDALIHEVTEADKEFQFKRTGREERRRALENGSNPYLEPDAVASATPASVLTSGTGNGGTSEVELGRADSTGSQLRGVISNTSSVSSQANAGSVASVAGTCASTTNPTAVGTPGQNRFKGIRDLEDQNTIGSDRTGGQQRKEGLLWALSRPGSHIDPKGINKQAWHK